MKVSNGLYVLVLLLIGLSLSACKIVIDAPEDGGVVDASGASICEAGQHCQISALDTSFDATYVADARAGKIFTGWKRQSRGLCGGSIEPCHLTTIAFGSNAALMSVLQSDAHFYLAPTFGEAAEHFHVSRIIDGDTVEVLNHLGEEVTVRLPGIDAPEGNQPYGDQATDALKSLVDDRLVRISGHSIDRYGRLLGEMYTLDGARVSVLLVSNGFAWWYVRYAASDTELAHAQERAQNEQRGLWSQPNPIAPWAWRTGAR